LAPENPAEVTVEAFPDKVYKAALRQVIPTADRTKATVLVKVTLLDKDPNLKPEMSDKVAFLSVANVREPNAPAPQPEITVPSTAVVVRDGADLVFVVEAGKAVARPVKLGDRRGANIIVNTGLVGSETLLSAPPDDLKSGDSVVSGAP
jgi:multidrug efflux pump subunit AcrA (membrane-fusion protein)